MKKIRNFNRGFSLVELIIVIGIMVSLVAVMAPQFVKYAQKSRDAVITATGEDVLSVAKVEYTEGHLSGSGYIRIATDDDGIVRITFVQDSDKFPQQPPLSYNNEGDVGEQAFLKACGYMNEKHCSSTLVYLIEVDGTFFAHPVIEQVENEAEIEEIEGNV